MELLDFSQLLATLLTVHPLLQPLVSLHQNQTLEKKVKDPEFTWQWVSVKSNWPSSMLWSTLERHHCTSPWSIHKQEETRSWPPPLREKDRNKEWDRLSFCLNTSEWTKLWERGCLTNLVVEFRKLHLNFIPLEVVILCLLTHRRDQVELTCHWICFLGPETETKWVRSAFRKIVIYIRY